MKDVTLLHVQLTNVSQGTVFMLRTVAAASCMGMVAQGGQSHSGKYESLNIQCQVLYRKLQMAN